MSNERKQSPNGTFMNEHYIGMVEGDSSRNKHWCMYYRNNEDKCFHPCGPYRGKHCQGASYCQEYKESSSKKNKEREE